MFNDLFENFSIGKLLKLLFELVCIFAIFISVLYAVKWFFGQSAFIVVIAFCSFVSTLVLVTSRINTGKKDKDDEEKKEKSK